MFKPIMQTAAFGIVAMLALGTSNVLAQSGPFGINPGDEMPSDLRSGGIHFGGLPYEEVMAPAGFDRMWVYGTENIGICAIRVKREFYGAAWEGIVSTLSDKYGPGSDTNIEDHIPDSRWYRDHDKIRSTHTLVES